MILKCAYVALILCYSCLHHNPKDCRGHLPGYSPVREPEVNAWAGGGNTQTFMLKTLDRKAIASMVLVGEYICFSTEQSQCYG